VKDRIRYYLWEDGIQWVFGDDPSVGHLYRCCRPAAAYGSGYRGTPKYRIPVVMDRLGSWYEWIKKGAPLRTRLGCIVFREEMKEPSE
jgi:hypothetical protein